MPEKKPFYIDENALREKLLNYQVSFNPASLNFLENEIDHVKTKAPIELPDAKKILQVVAIPAIVIVFGVIAYFGFNYIKDISEQSAAKKDSVATVKPIVAPKVEIKKEEVKPPVVTTASVAPEIKKKDSIVETPVVASHSISITAKEVKDTDKKSPKDQVVIAKKDDESSSAKSTHTKPDSVKKTPVDTAAVAKKKKKKKKASDVTEEIRQSTQQPNSSDDDVVVPNN